MVLLALTSSLVLLLPLLLWRREILRRFSGARLVSCPENHESAVVEIDSRHAAASSINGPPDIRLCDCTRWPGRAACRQGCLSEALRAQPPQEVAPTPGRKVIYHLPILLAAFAAWYIGAIWHSQYLFRARWAGALGLTRADTRALAWQLAPHLLTAAICLLFAYGVGSLLALLHRKGILAGIVVSLGLSVAVLAAVSWSIARLPRDLLLIELSYFLIAALTIGAIIGGLEKRLLRTSAHP